jgi:GDPmannose 4,6-dehydratase
VRITIGQEHSVREFVTQAAKELGMTIRWVGTGVTEKGYLVEGKAAKQTNESTKNNSIITDKCIVEVDPRYFRSTEVETLLGDAAKAQVKLNWTPRVKFDELVAEMAREDLESAKRDALVTKHGYSAMSYHE